MSKKAEYILKINLLHNGVFLKKGSICPDNDVKLFLSNDWIVKQ